MFSSKLISLKQTLTNLFLIRVYSSQPYRILHKMNVAYFRCLPNLKEQEQQKQLQITFHYTNSELRIDRDFNFCRNFSEIIDVFLDRIKNNIEKELTKKSKKKKSKKSNENATNEEEKDNEQPPCITVQMLRKEEPVNNISFEELLRNEDVHTNLKLRILEDDFKITYNLPWVANIALPSSILAGFILYPCKLELQFAEKNVSHGIWYRGLLPKSKNVNDIEWQKIHEGLTYKTVNNDIGHYIKFEFIPRNSKVSGPSAECISKNEVQAGPGLCPFENRHQFTKDQLTGDEFRMISYNVLADLYADSDYTRKELFPYCPPYALHIDYRKQLFIKEILGYNGDLICLQEVDGKIFDLDLVPVLDIYGYNGTFKQKGKTGEGLATFYRKDRFELIENYSFNIGESIEKVDIFKSIWEKIKVNENLAQRVVNRSTALQVNLFKSLDTGNLLLIANTHLYFHPNADHVRLLQNGICMIYLEDIYNKIIRDVEMNEKTLSLIFCGDFNSTPECGIYKLMTEKYVDENFIDWSSCEVEAVKGVSLTQPFNIKSACGCPEYTNYTDGFFGCLDYIYYQTDNLDVKEVIPFPSHEEVKANVAIPSIVFPSDHLALIANLKFR